jgi:hypothetical protein
VSYYDLDAQFRPIERWPGKLRTWSERKRSLFSAPWRKTLELLQRELFHLDARDIVIQADLREADIRLDGYPRANARAGHPGIILAFASKHGPLQYAVDTYDDWQDNLRAIALALEALRAVDRYGVTRRGEQYTGWKAIEAGNGLMTVEAAARFMADHASSATTQGILADPEVAKTVYRRLARRFHPDAGGDAGLFQRLQEAKRLLDQHGGAP